MRLRGKGGLENESAAHLLMRKTQSSQTYLASKIGIDCQVIMHAISGAMAIRRERQKRESRRLQRQGKSPRASDASNMEAGMVGTRRPPLKTDSSSLTAFHLGVVFILLGFLMIFSSMIPSSVVDADWSKLLGVGITFLFIGLMMVMVNRIVSTREEEELKKYVSNRLGRTRSGHVLYRDHESVDDFKARQYLRTNGQNPGAAVRSSFRRGHC